MFILHLCEGAFKLKEASGSVNHEEAVNKGKALTLQKNYETADRRTDVMSEFLNMKAAKAAGFAIIAYKD